MRAETLWRQVLLVTARRTPAFTRTTGGLSRLVAEISEHPTAGNHLGKHRCFRPMRRHPVVLASGLATAFVIATTGLAAVKIAQDAQVVEHITRVLFSPR